MQGRADAPVYAALHCPSAASGRDGAAAHCAEKQQYYIFYESKIRKVTTFWQKN